MSQKIATFTPLELESYAVALRHVQPTGVPLHVCAELFAQAHARLDGRSLLRAVDFFLDFHPDRPNFRSLAELVSDFAGGRAAMGVHPDYVQNIRRQLGRLVTAFPDKTIAQLRTADLDRWIATHAWQPRTKNDVRKICITFGHWAKARSHLPFNRPTEFAGMLRYKVPSTKIAIYTPSELRAIVTAVKTHRPALLPWLACAAFTGARIAELAHLRWEHLDFTRGFVVVASQKIRTKARRLVPLQPALRGWLQRYRKECGPIATCADPRAAVARVAAHAGLKLCRNGFRHSYVSYRVAQTADLARVALESGNSPDMICQFYRELVTPKEARAWFQGPTVPHRGRSQTTPD